MKKLSILFVCALLLFSCQSEDEVQEVKIGKKFSLTIPSFLKRADTLNRESSLQYQNTFREFYVLVFDESREEITKALTEGGLSESDTGNLKVYSDILMANFEQGIEVALKENKKETVINGNPAIVMNLAGKSAGVDAYFSIAYIEGKKRYYQIVVWTLKDRRDKYKDKMDAILMSLKEG